VEDPWVTRPMKHQAEAMSLLGINVDRVFKEPN